MSGLLAALFPISLVVALWGEPAASWIARGLLVVSVTPDVRILTRPLSRAERLWAKALGVYLGAICAAALGTLVTGDLSPELSGSVVLDVLRQAFLVIVAFLLMLSLRHPKARRGLGVGLTILSGATLAVLAVTYAQFLVSAARSGGAFKTFAREAGVSTNTLVYAAVLSGIASYPTWGRTRKGRFAGVAAIVVAVALSGARTTQVSLMVAFFLTRAETAIRSLGPKTRMLLRTIVVSSTIVVVFLSPEIDTLIDPYAASSVTTGRFDLWVAAATRAAQNPVFGAGTGSSRFELEQYLPEYYEWGREALIESMGSGGYHSAYLAVVCERGIVGTVGAVGLIVILLRLAARAGSVSKITSGSDSSYASVFPFLVKVMLLRGVAEQGGLFGNADSLVDFATYAAIGTGVAILSMVERTGRTTPGYGDVFAPERSVRPSSGGGRSGLLR
jgi:hypothetical protein